MGLLDALKRAEMESRKAARRGMERAIVPLDDAERVIRRRMRIYPQQIAAAQAAAAKRKEAGASPGSAAAVAPATELPPERPQQDRLK